ncbi:hypothetical protein GCM10023205_81500 [Yinghuangia aomiensis]|uniref:Uncharacterized protein n=1 Tax=Yinghuangia aomiensis TaxID=676205 RepID=A0ABP9IEE3_9ACTN
MTAPVLPADVEERFAAARQIADAVLFEGYVLYPYRASAAKNRLRWQFGVLVPPGYGVDRAEHAYQRTECLVEPRGADARLAVELRFLRTRRRTVQRAAEDGTFGPAEALELRDRRLVPWDEGVEERVVVDVPVADLRGDGIEHPFSLAAADDEEAVHEDGVLVGRLLYRRERVEGVIRLSATEVPGPYAALRLSAVVANTSAWAPHDGAERDDALAHSLISAHVLLGLAPGSFVSVTDPPEWAMAAVAECRNEHCWPVLVDGPGRDDVMLASPIILEDRPQVAPESPGVLYDATEIDEILALRTAALTDEEKREARGTDARAGAVVDLADSLPPEVLDRLHGAVRALREVTDTRAAATERPETPWWDPGGDPHVDPETDHVVVDGVHVAAGSRVVLRPGQRRTDAQDAFLHGRTALVEAVLHDVDGAVHVAVTVDGDPGADLWRAQGRFRYFQPDEIAPVPEAAG